MNFLEIVDRRRSPILLIGGFILVLVVGLFDYITGYEMSLSLFYLLPIALVSWIGGRWAGVSASVFAAMVRIVVDVLSGYHFSSGFIVVWNGSVRLGVFVVVALLLAELRRAFEREKEFSRTDYLTGAANSRMFDDLFRIEIERSRRYKRPFSLAYIDLDNFKSVNDQFGHDVGDSVLRAAVGAISSKLRKTDIVARLGGDEFALLLPECGEREVRVVVDKIRESLVMEMERNDWPVTCSVGALTCIESKLSKSDLIKKADNLMYAVKSQGKNGISYAVDR